MRLVLATTMSFVVIGLWPTAGAETTTPPIPPAATAPVKTTAPKPQTIDCDVKLGYNVRISSARGMMCRTAKRELLKGLGAISRKFETGGGYSCRRVSGNSHAGQWRCTKGSSHAFRFEFNY